jgi:carbon-monoxide dehydrogenase large subunit
MTDAATTDPTLRPKIIGARVQRREDPRLLTGGGSYVDDRKVAGLLHVALLRSPHPHARIVGIDTAAAEAMPGVVAVLTAETLDGSANPVRAQSRMRDYHATVLEPLARGKVRHVGEPVVAVVADSRYRAEDAVEAVAVGFDPLPAPVDPEAAAAPDAPLLHEEAGTNVLAAREFARGAVDETLAGAAVRVGGRFRFRRKTPVAIENRSYLADYDRGRRALTLHAATQVPGIVRDALAEALDMPGHRLRVIAPDVGGGFGGKASLYAEELLVCLLARQLGRPVKWTSDRMEDLTTTSQGFDEIVDATLGLDAEGRILGLAADVVGDVGAYSIYPWTAAIEPIQVVSFLPGPYRIPDYRGRVKAVATAKATGGPYRGVGRPAATFVIERLVDMAAAELGIDPAELRRRNLIREDEFPYKAGSGLIWDRAGFQDCLEAACRAVDYDALRREQTAARAAGRWFGIGITSYAELTGIGSRISASPGMPLNTGTETATVRIDSTGAVTAVFGLASQGQGIETSLAQVVAEELGARVEDIEVLHGDSAAVPFSTGTYASRGAILGGGAGTLAARAVREQVVQAAAHLLEAAAADIEVADGVASVAGTDRQVTFRELARAVYSEMRSLPPEVRETIELEATRLYDPRLGTTSCACHVAALEIDPETYAVTIRRYLVAEDCGRVINPLIVEGQVHGGVAQGIGVALFEEVVYDDTGQLLTASLIDYVVPSAAEIPSIDVLHVDTAPPDNLGGFRGMGEGGTIGAPAAVANAVADALAPLGVAITEVPITPERLYRLIEQAKTKGAQP